MKLFVSGNNFKVFEERKESKHGSLVLLHFKFQQLLVSCFASFKSGLS